MLVCSVERGHVGCHCDYAACNLSSLPDFLLLNSARCFEVPAETHLLVHGMNKHVQIRDLLCHLQLFALWSQRAAVKSRHTWQRLSLVVKCPPGASHLEGIPCIG